MSRPLRSTVLLVASLWGWGTRAPVPLSESIDDVGKGPNANNASGAALPYDATSINDAEYSPSGRYLAFATEARMPPGQTVIVIDFETNRVWDARDLASDTPGHHFNSARWVGDHRLWLFEHWVAQDGEELAWCLVDVASGRTERRRPFHWDDRDVPYFPVGRYDGTRWLVAPNSGTAVYLYDPEVDGVGEPLVTAGPGESVGFWPPSAPWVPKVREGRGTPPGADVTFINVADGRMIAVTVPLVPTSQRGALITSDGRYVIAPAVQAQSTVFPVVFNSETGETSAIAGATWLPVALSEARGVLLVGQPPPQDAPQGEVADWDYFEVPLASILPAQ